MQPFTLLQSKLLEIAGGDVQLVSERFDGQCFGSWIAIYEGRHGAFRLIWDGRDGWGFLQRQTGLNDWVDVEPFLTEGDIEGVPQNAQKLESFSRSVRALVEEAK
jgi:hypothetical protein